MFTKSSSQNWYVVYTLPKSEKKVAASIANMGFESYLPLHSVYRQWSDRKKKIEVPLFPNYVFVKTDDRSKGYLYSIRELVKFISVEKKPVVVQEKVINTIRQVLREDSTVTSEAYFQEGMSVRVKYGQFAGLEGIILVKKGSARIIVKIDGLRQAFSFEICTSMVEILDHSCMTVV